MLRVKRLLVPITPIKARCFLKGEEKLLPTVPLHNPSQWASTRFLNMFQLASKEAIQKERARINDEMSRGYFEDMSEFRKHGGKIALANKIIIPAVAALKFPIIEVNCSDGSTLKLPAASDGKGSDKSKPDIPKASLVCLSFRANSGPMVDSWSSPFLNNFGYSRDVRLYEVSFIDSWLLRRDLIKKLLLKVMRKPKPEEQHVLQRQVVYHFDDHYYFRKELRIINLLTGYVFLLDNLGRIRWQGFGYATLEELSSLMFCTSLLLEEKKDQSNPSKT